MTKVVGIEGGKKKEPCRFCGAEPACPDWTCSRLKAVQVDSEGWAVEFWPEDEFEWEVDDADG